MKPLHATRLLPGAVCTMLLHDLGAEIIKIEDPNGGDYARWIPPLIDGMGAFFRFMMSDNFGLSDFAHVERELDRPP